MHNVNTLLKCVSTFSSFYVNVLYSVGAVFKMVAPRRYRKCEQYAEKVKVGNDQEKAQSERNSHSRNSSGKTQK